MRLEDLIRKAIQFGAHHKKEINLSGYDTYNATINRFLLENKVENLAIHSVVVNEAVKLYEPCKKGKETMCKCKSDQDCRDQSEVELCQCKGMRSYMAKPKGRFCLKCDKYIWHN